MQAQGRGKIALVRYSDTFQIQQNIFIWNHPEFEFNLRTNNF